MIDVVRILLACVFVVAGVAKLADLESSRRALAGFSVREPLARPLGFGLPLAELAIAAGLLFTMSARYAAVAAAGLLAMFCVAIGTALAKGRRPDCHCFGRLHSASVGSWTLVRNVALTALAVVVASTPASPVRPVALLAAAGAVLVTAQAVGWLVLLRRYGRALARIDELEAPTSAASTDVGSPAPELTALALDGRETSLRDLLDFGRRVLVVFVHAECQPCLELLPRLAAWEVGGTITVAVVTTGDRATIAALAEEHGLRHLLVHDGFELMDRYGVVATPSAVLVDSDGRIASALATGATEVEDLVESLVADGASSDGPSSPRTRIALRAVAGAGALVATSASHAGTTEPVAAPGTPTLTSTLQTLHVQLGRVAKRLNRALSNLQPPARPAGAAAPSVARWAATGRALVAGAQVTIRREKQRPATGQVLAYLSSLHAGFAAFERAGTAKDLRVAAKHARDGAEHFDKASRRFLPLDRALGCPFGCTPVKGANP